MATTQDVAREAFEKLEAASGVQSDVAPTEDAGESTDVSTSAPDEPGRLAGDAGPDSVGETPGRAMAGEGRARDATGKFAKAEVTKTDNPKAAKQAASTPVPKAGEASGTTPPVAGQPTPTPAPKFKPPQSWSPAAREHWATMAEAAQAEVDRREKEIARALQEASEPKKFHQQFQQLVSPYMGMIQAEGSDPLKAVGSLLQTAAALRTAPPAHKAQLVASLVQQFGVPVDALDAALAGQAPPPGQAAPFDPQQLIQQAKAEFARDLAQQRQSALMQTAAQEAQAFAEKAEFFEDVREDIAELLEVAGKRGRAMTLEEAYNRAVALHPDISKVLKQREAAEAAKTQEVSTRRNVAATTSVKAQPAPQLGGGRPKTSRDAAMEAWDKLSGR